MNNNNNCMSRLKSDPLKQCHRKRKHGDFCNIHQNTKIRIDIPLYSDITIKHALDISTINNIIDVNLMKYCLYINNKSYIGTKNEIKMNFIKLKNNLNYYNENILNIIKLQALTRGWLVRYINYLKGPGLWNRSECVNDCDFYTFEEKQDINYNSFFSYKDVDNFIYCFDIRSFYLLTNNDNKNPYNRKLIPYNSLNNMNKLIQYLQKNNLLIDFEKDILDEEQLLRQKVISIFQKIDRYNYNTNINWFLDLNFFLLKKFYGYLEDIWSYRAQLTHEAKLKIVKNGALTLFKKYGFVHNLSMTNANKKKSQDIILNDMDKLVSRGETPSDSSLGALYILIALAMVSYNCASSMPWLLQSL